MLKTIRVVKDIVENGFSKKKISMYLIVMNFLLVIGSVLFIFLTVGLSAFIGFLPDMMYDMGLYSSDVDVIMAELGNIFGVLGLAMIPQVLGVIIIICFNIVLIKLRNKLKAIFAY